jgi:predicted ATPase/DNA-binding SARP family transcriptional activator
VDFRILGPLEIWDDGRPLAIGSAKQRALLAILLLNANRVVPTSRLIELLWGDEPSETVANTLQVAVSQLRKILEKDHPRGTPYQVLVSQPPGYLLRVAADQLDLYRFEQLRHEADQASQGADPDTTADRLREALNLWRGPALADVASQPFALAEATRLNELRIQTLEDRIEAELSLGRHGDLIGELQALVTEYPLRERLRGQLMLALYRSGRQAEASDLFHKTRAVLVDQLGMEPGPDLQKLFKSILNQDPGLNLAPARTVKPPRSADNLPIQLTSFIGRADEIAQIKQLFSQSRMVTITGPAGMGKTRLGIEVARQLREFNPDGVWLTELAPVDAPELVAQSVALTLGVREQPGRPLKEALVDYLQSRQLLLVVDNCEHVIDASARLIETMLRSSPGLKVLATSREDLRIPGEVPWRLPPLPVPGATVTRSGTGLEGYAALRLFADRAQPALGSTELGEQDWRIVAEICRRLDGIPLAIELAAGKLRTLSLEQVNDRLGDRLHLLTGGTRTAMSRHQTLRAAIDWSYELLSNAQRAFFRGLSVFAGSFGLPAAEAIGCRMGLASDDVLDLLTELVGKSLASVEKRSGSARYRLLESLRQYGSEKLNEAGESQTVQDEHRKWFLALAEHAEFRGPLQTVWFDRLELEHDDLRAALARSLDQQDAASSLRLAAAMGYFWRQRGFMSEGLKWSERALKLSDGAEPARGRTFLWASALAMEVGDYSRAVHFAEQSFAACEQRGDVWGMGFAQHVLGFVAFRQDDQQLSAALLEQSAKSFEKSGQKWGIALGLHSLGLLYWASAEYERAVKAAEQALILFRDAGDEERVAASLRLLGTVQRTVGNFTVARDLLSECATLFERLGAKQSLAATNNELGIVHRCLGDLKQAHTLQEASLGGFRSLNVRQGAAYALVELGIIAIHTNEVSQAVPAIIESLAIFRELGDKVGIIRSVEALAATEVEAQPYRATALLGGVEALRESSGVPIDPYERPWHDAVLASVRQALGEAGYAGALAEGRSRSLDEMIRSWLEGRDASASRELVVATPFDGRR